MIARFVMLDRIDHCEDAMPDTLSAARVLLFVLAGLQLNAAGNLYAQYLQSRTVFADALVLSVAALTGSLIYLGLGVALGRRRRWAYAAAVLLLVLPIAANAYLTLAARYLGNLSGLLLPLLTLALVLLPPSRAWFAADAEDLAGEQPAFAEPL